MRCHALAGKHRACMSICKDQLMATVASETQNILRKAVVFSARKVQANRKQQDLGNSGKAEKYSSLKMATGIFH